VADGSRPREQSLEACAVTDWLLIAGCAVVLALPLIWRAVRGTFDPFEPIVLFALAWGTMFVARPASILIEDDRRFWGVDIRPTLPSALLLALLGAVSFVVAYELRFGRTLEPRLPAPRSIDARIAAGAAIMIAGLGVVALVVFLPTSEGIRAVGLLLHGRTGELTWSVRDSSNYLWYGSLLVVPAAFVLIALAMRTRRALVIAAAVVVTALALLRVGPVGGREQLLPLVGGIFVLAYLVRDRRPRARTLAIVAAAALLASFFIGYLRDPTDALTTRSAAEDLRHRPQGVLNPILRGEDAEMVLALSAALTVVPDRLPYRYGGATVGSIVTRPIPRGLWPGKPLSPGEKVVSTIWPQYFPDLNPAFSPLLVFYWDFGLAGVALGMFAFGALARLLYDWFRRYRYSFGAQLIYSVGLWFVVIGCRDETEAVVALASFIFLPVVAIVAIAAEGVLPADFLARRTSGDGVERPSPRLPSGTS
jgi:hypothetical protein